MTSQLYQTSFYALFFAVLLCNVGGFQYSVTRENRVKLSKMSNHFYVATGRWADFATGDGGGDLVSLAAFVSGLPQREACIRLAESMGVYPWA